MLFIRKLLWDQRNISHIERHSIGPKEVEEVCRKQPIIQRGTIKNRIVLLGPTYDERLLNIVLEGRGKGMYYVITAYAASAKDIKLYKRLKGGEEK